MPWYRYDEPPEGYEGDSYDDVVDRKDYDALQTESNGFRDQRDAAIARAETAEAAYEKEREKYANAFLTTPERVKDEHNERYATTYDELWR